MLRRLGQRPNRLSPPGPQICSKFHLVHLRARRRMPWWRRPTIPPSTRSLTSQMPAPSCLRCRHTLPTPPSRSSFPFKTRTTAVAGASLYNLPTHSRLGMRIRSRSCEEASRPGFDEEKFKLCHAHCSVLGYIVSDTLMIMVSFVRDSLHDLVLYDYSRTSCGSMHPEQCDVLGARRPCSVLWTY